MARSDEQEGGAVLFRLHQLLSEIHQGLFRTRPPTLQPDSERRQIRAGKLLNSLPLID